MAKRLVVCCDGTWNTADQKHATNVTKFALSVADADENGVEQRVFYDPGVGSNRADRFRGGIFGVGLSKNVRTPIGSSWRPTPPATSCSSWASAGAPSPPAAP